VPIRVYDFFSGCGGTSAGLRAAGMRIILGIDIDHDAAETYRRNFPDAHFIEDDINDIATEALEAYGAANPRGLRLFSCCAPCQSFSILNRNRNYTDERARLLLEFSRFIEFYTPHLIFLENVPGVRAIDITGGPFAEFEALLRQLGYELDYNIVESQGYGVPQRRRRFILMASRLGEITLPQPTHGPGTDNAAYPTVWQWIGHLPPIGAGERHPNIPNHQSAGLSEINLRRIMATPAGGGRLTWPENLRLPCHQDYDGHTDVYGRMRPNEPSTGLTTRCISISNGRFGHPYQHRAISAREGACLQTFPMDFIFEGSLTAVARQVGNAVPVLLAQNVGERFVQHARQHGYR
jgi:DNA (cytosine-5)-methyltransferase 1